MREAKVKRIYLASFCLVLSYLLKVLPFPAVPSTGLGLCHVFSPLPFSPSPWFAKKRFSKFGDQQWSDEKSRVKHSVEIFLNWFLKWK